MRRLVLTYAALCAAALAAPATSARAQEKGIELSVGVLGFTNVSCSGCSSTFAITAGGGYIAGGFYLSPHLAIDPTLSLAYASGGGASITSWGIGVGVPYYFSNTWGHSGWFLEPGLTYRSYASTGSTTLDQTSLGVEGGVKLPLNAGAALRLAALYEYGFKSSTVKQTNAIGLALGLSAFIK
jgi:hypothetical protein